MPWISPPLEFYDQLRWDTGPLLLHFERGLGYRRSMSDGDWEFSTSVWQTRHGRALAIREDGGAYQVRGALLPDGRRVDCRRSRAGFSLTQNWRRRSDDGKGWLPGRVTFSPREVTFADGGGPNYVPDPADPPRLWERTLASNARIMSLLQDDWFAQSACDWLGSRSTCSVDGATIYFEGTRSTADIVARLRGVGECYLDFHAGLFDPPMRYHSSSTAEELFAANIRMMSPEEELAAEQRT